MCKFIPGIKCVFRLVLVCAVVQICALLDILLTRWCPTVLIGVIVSCRRGFEGFNQVCLLQQGLFVLYVDSDSFMTCRLHLIALVRLHVPDLVFKDLRHPNKQQPTITLSSRVPQPNNPKSLLQPI